MKVQTAGSSKADITLFPTVLSIDQHMLMLIASMRYNVPALEQNFTIGLALVPVLNFAAGTLDPLRKYLVTLRNSSPAAQNIRIGGAPNFGGGVEAGQLLAPGNTIVFDGMCVQLNAIADAANALLSVLCYATAQLV
ncbi:MAG: hypothetical protein WC329_04415 [Candidatus Omnitrophota bacterium]|jgi:hypothetical protein